MQVDCLEKENEQMLNYFFVICNFGGQLVSCWTFVSSSVLIYLSSFWQGIQFRDLRNGWPNCNKKNIVVQKCKVCFRRRKSNQYVRAWKPALIKLKIFIHISSNLFKLSLNAVPSEKLQLNHLKLEIFLFDCIFL